MYRTVIKEKCRKNSSAARIFYIFLVISNTHYVLSQCNTELRLLYLINKESPKAPNNKTLDLWIGKTLYRRAFTSKKKIVLISRKFSLNSIFQNVVKGKGFYIYNAGNIYFFCGGKRTATRIPKKNPALTRAQGFQKNKHAVNRAIISFTQHPHYLCYFSL